MAIICIANSKGGTGKSSVAINLQHHMKIDVIIDIDTTHHALSKILSLSDKSYDIRLPKSENEILELCQQLSEEGKNVLIDCGGFDSVFNQYAISQADLVLTPTNDDPSEQIGISEFNEVMRKASEMVDTKLIAHVLITKVHPSRRDFSMLTDYIDTLEHLEVLPLVIPFSAQIPKAQYEGSAVKSGSIAARFNKLASLINDKVSVS